MDCRAERSSHQQPAVIVLLELPSRRASETCQVCSRTDCVTLYYKRQTLCEQCFMNSKKEKPCKRKETSTEMSSSQIRHESQRGTTRIPRSTHVQRTPRQRQRRVAC